MVTRAGVAFGKRYRWMPRLVGEVLEAYEHPPLDRSREVATWISLRPRFRAGTRRSSGQHPAIRRWTPVKAEMGRTTWPVVPLATPAELAALLEVTVSELAWFADRRSIERTTTQESFRHYRYSWLAKPSGGARLVESPKPRLKAIQRRLLAEVLNVIPVHAAAHGFVAGRSPVSFATPHVLHRLVVAMDLEDFFASVSAGRIYGVFRTAGYPELVAYTLTGLTTNVVPSAVWKTVARPVDAGTIDRHHRLGRSLATPHLPQGAPTSPALANLCAHGLDRRLSGLAESRLRGSSARPHRVGRLPQPEPAPAASPHAGGGGRGLRQR
jgi:hypothetical protein